MAAEPSSEVEQLNALNKYQRELFLSSFRLVKLNNEFLEKISSRSEDLLNYTR